MNAQEALVLIRLIRAGCPGQRFDEFTIDVWAEALRDVDFGQARDAVMRLVKQQPFIAVSEVIGDAARHQREALRRLRDRGVLNAIEAAKAEADTTAAEEARRETREAFQRALEAKQARQIEAPADPIEEAS